jgi:putative inorganic carbon (HCO3(-)) transporter
LENQGIMRLHGVGLWSHFNSFSQFALGVIPFCFYLYPIVKKKWLQLGIVSLLLFSTYVVIYTGSRTGYLGFIIMLVLFYTQSSIKIRKRLLLLIILLTPITIVLLPNQYKERFMSSFSGKEREGSSKESRIKLYREGWYIFKHHPFGVGVGNYPVAGQKYFDYDMEQHCLYTEILTEIGIQGFAVFMLLMWKIKVTLHNAKLKLNNILQSCRDIDQTCYISQDILLTLAVIQSTLVYFYLRLFLDIFSMDLYAIPWWFVIGISSSIHLITNDIITKCNNSNYCKSMT